MHCFFVDQVARTIMAKNIKSDEEINLEVESFESYKQLVEVTNDKIFPLINSAFQAIDDNFVQVVEFYDRYVTQLTQEKQLLEKENNRIKLEKTQLSEIHSQTQSMSETVVQAHAEIAGLKMAIMEMHKDIRAAPRHVPQLANDAVPEPTELESHKIVDKTPI